MNGGIVQRSHGSIMQNKLGFEMNLYRCDIISLNEQNHIINISKSSLA